MFSPKVKPGQTQGAAELLFGKDAGKPWAERTAAEEEAPAPAETAGPEEVPALERRSYRILRGRNLHVPSLKVSNRQGQNRVFPWSYFGGAGMDQPGELVLTFDGPDGSSAVTVSGRGLDQELLPGIEANRVEWIRELDELTAAAVARAVPGEPVVTGIWIVGGKREWTRSAAAAKGGRQP
jgi:hypothetical protein